MPGMDLSTLRLRGDDFALVIIDIQERLAAAMPSAQNEAVGANAGRLIALANELQAPILVTEQYPQGLGRTLTVLAEALPSQTVPLEKVAFSCMAADGFAEAVKNINRRDIILIGMETHVCVLQSVLDLIERGYHVFVPEDGVASRSEANRLRGLALMEQAGAIITSTETLMFQALGGADHPSFRTLQKLLK
jgi:nicotinamidase-related amidase